MEQPPITPAPPPAAASQAPAMPLYARLLNIFAVPGLVFEDVKRSRVAVSNWLVPLLLLIIVCGVSFGMQLSHPKSRQKLFNDSEKALEQQVKAGKMAPKVATQQREMRDFFLQPLVLQGVGFGVGTVVALLKVFGWAFALWIIAVMALRVRVRYTKLLEIAGLAALIFLLQVVAETMIQGNLIDSAVADSQATGATEGSSYWLMMGFMLFQIWQIFLLAVGLARLTDLPVVRAGSAVFSLWFMLMFAKLMLMWVAGFGG